MTLKDTLLSDAEATFRNGWTTRQGNVVPDASSVQLGNDAVKLTGAVLYADLAESTNMVKNFPDYFSAEVYKVYLNCASKIITSEGGVITAFDGDRVMAVYIGDNKENRAIRAALKIHYAVEHIVNPKMLNQYKNGILSGKSFKVKQAVGVDISELYIARTGIRGSNDLVWVGNAANNAAKLCSQRTGDFCSWITQAAYDAADNSVKLSNGNSMWQKMLWNGQYVYRSNYWWNL